MYLSIRNYSTRRITIGWMTICKCAPSPFPPPFFVQIFHISSSTHIYPFSFFYL